MSCNLSTAVSKHQYPEFQSWWPVGESFLGLMADAIVCQWRALVGSQDSVDSVQTIFEEYVEQVYCRHARPGLAVNFAAGTELDSVQSGEFDALSYAYFYSTYRALASRFSGDELSSLRREFAERVGTHFFSHLSDLLNLEIPSTLLNDTDLALLEAAIQHVGRFLLEQGYLRSHFSFHFEVSTSHAGATVTQGYDDILGALDNGGTAYALYEMGHPVILPSAVYLHQTVGEAQHHSSRTIEELFARVGCDAWETDDFDPSLYPSNLVVELWQIRRRSPPSL